MRYIGLDLGTRTVGVAYSDYSNSIALPDQTYRFSGKDDDEILSKALEFVKEVVDAKQADRVVLGLPKNMDGSLGFQAEYCLKFKKMIEDNLHLEVFMYDERLSSVEVGRIMSSADYDTRKQKKKVDTLSAVLILQSYLDQQKFKERNN